ncbi:MAG: hypothetical protein SFV23_01685 [Planctomycetaceae bacterium]|nr:hypothetical protein [Planctomycetaceae bacterium]
MPEELPERGVAARIVVLEAGPYWGPELQRAFLDSAIDVRSCDRVDLVEQAIADVEWTALVWDFVADRARMLPWLGERVREDRAPPVIVCSEPAEDEWEWLLRSCGVISWSREQQTTADLALLCRRWILKSRGRLSS